METTTKSDAAKNSASTSTSDDDGDELHESFHKPKIRYGDSISFGEATKDYGSSSNNAFINQDSSSSSTTSDNTEEEEVLFFDIESQQ